MISKILVPTDGSEVAQTAMHVIKPIEDYLREAAEAYAGEIKEWCEKCGVQSKTVITTGHRL